MKNLKQNILFLLLVCLGSVISLHAQTERFSRNIFANGKGDTLKYRAIYPDYNKTHRYPLVIFLHGSGERGNDNEAQLQWGVMNFATDQALTMHPAIIIAPQCPEDQEWSYTDDENQAEIHFRDVPSKPMELLHQLIRQIIKDALVDTNRIYITGLSMGGYGTYDAITRYPDLFAAAIPVCGGGDTSKAAVFAHIPIWIYHGSEDPVVDPLLSVEMANALIKAGAHPGLTLCPEFGHFSWLAAYSDPLLIEWMFRQHK
jgi:predicted peptidase